MTNHNLSQVVCAAFAEGAKGKLVDTSHLRDGDAAVYGILRGCGEIITACEWLKRDYYYIDNGYFKPGHFDGYYRIVKNGRQGSYYESRSDRWERLGVDLRPWRRRGRKILVVPPSGYVAAFDKIDSGQWSRLVACELSRWTDRAIQFKPSKGRMDEALEDTWCLVTYNSNAAIHALREGVPVITLGDHIAEHVSWSFENIESPWWPEREFWAWSTAYQQYTLDEFRSGRAWALASGQDN